MSASISQSMSVSHSSCRENAPPTATGRVGSLRQWVGTSCSSQWHHRPLLLMLLHWLFVGAGGRGRGRGRGWKARHADVAVHSLGSVLAEPHAHQVVPLLAPVTLHPAYLVRHGLKATAGGALPLLLLLLLLPLPLPPLPFLLFPKFLRTPQTPPIPPSPSPSCPPGGSG